VRIFSGVLVGGVALVLAAGPLLAQNRPPLDDLLSAAGAYVAAYEHEISAIVAEEDYLQISRATVGSATSRRLRSDFLVLNLSAGWIGFRDVFEVDGRPVRDRQERLAALFLKPTVDALGRAQEIATESARFNLSRSVTVDRTINVPMIALRFLEPGNQRRSAFQLAGTEKVGGVECQVVRFIEQVSPRLLSTDSESAASGTFWIERGSGRVRRSELLVDSARTLTGRRTVQLSVGANIRVDYAEEPRLQLWLPVTMSEHYDISPNNETIDGRATYSNFRQFQVETGMGIRTP